MERKRIHFDETRKCENCGNNFLFTAKRSAQKQVGRFCGSACSRQAVGSQLGKIYNRSSTDSRVEKMRQKKYVRDLNAAVKLLQDSKLFNVVRL
jgi:CRISPR/Cas system-associated protein Cas10 (large subunit of type III CRISPR-Cas system)